MGKYGRIALALLYLAQAAVMCREAILQAYEGALKDGGRTAVREQILDEFRFVLKRAVRPDSRPSATLVAPPHDRHGLLVATHGEKHQHEPESRKDRIHRTERSRRRKIAGRILANLFPEFRRIAPAYSWPSGQTPLPTMISRTCLRPKAGQEC